MRSRIAALSLLVAGQVAVADAPRRPPAPRTEVPASRPIAAPPAAAAALSPIEVAELPAQCKAIGKQATAANVPTALSARISLASCLADTRLATLTLLDCEESVLAVEEATKPSVALLDEVSAAARDDAMKIVAERAKAELYVQMTTRMLATVPPPGTTASSIAMHDVRRGILDGLLARWRDAAAVSYERILAIVKVRPALERDPVVATAVRIAKDRLRLHVASARPQPAPDAEPPADAERGDAHEGAKTDVDEQLR